MNPLSQEDILAKFGKDTLPKADPEAVRIFTENTIAAFQEEIAGCAIHLASFQSLFTLSPSQPHHLLIDKKGLQARLGPHSCFGLAQSVEQWTVNPWVASSSLASGENKEKTSQAAYSFASLNN